MLPTTSSEVLYCCLMETNPFPIRPFGFNIEQVRSVLGRSYLFEKCQFIYHTDNVMQLISEFDSLMLGDDVDFCAESIATIHVAGIMLYMLNHNDLSATQSERSLFLQRCYNFMICYEETYIHQLCEFIFGLLDMSSSTNMLNLILCCRHGAPLCIMGQLVCSCLLWSVLDKLLDFGQEKHWLRPYSHIMIAIGAVNPPVYVESYLHPLNLIVRTISALLVSGPYGAKESQLKLVTESQEMLTFNFSDASVLSRWLNNILTELRADMHQKDEMSEERLVVSEECCELLELVNMHMVKVYQGLYNPNGPPGDDEDEGLGCVLEEMLS